VIQRAAQQEQTVEMTEKAVACCRKTAELAAGGETILFVEDETFVREVTGEVLRSAGYRVLVAKDAATAARTYDVESANIDLLLTDVVLPGENGPALAARLRRASPQLKVLLITGYAEQMGLQQAGSGAWLAKPFSVGMLLRKVKQVLDREGRATAE